MDKASREGNVELLERLKMESDVSYSTDAMDDASRYGHLHVLEWWKRSGLHLVYLNAVDLASQYGHIDVLNWWMTFCKESGRKLPYTYVAMELVNHNAAEVLKWWFNMNKENELELLYSHIPINVASRNGNIKMLDCWLHSGLPVRYTTDAFTNATIFANTAVKWWIDHNDVLPIKYEKDIVTTASIYGNTTVLDWLLSQELVVNYGPDCIDYAHSVDVLEWWFTKSKTNGLEFKYTEKAIDNASLGKQVEFLEWWINSGLDIKYASSCDIMFKKNHLFVINHLIVKMRG